MTGKQRALVEGRVKACGPDPEITVAVERLNEAMEVYRIVERQPLLEKELYRNTFEEHGRGDLPWS